MFRPNRVQILLICAILSDGGAFRTGHHPLRLEAGHSSLKCERRVRSFHLPPLVQQKKRGAGLFLKDSDDDREGEDKFNSLGQKIFFYTLETFGYAIQFLSTLVAAGFVLNLLGYVYQWDGKEGLQIDTLPHMREQNQFKRADRELMREAPTSLPRSTLFGK